MKHFRTAALALVILLVALTKAHASSVVALPLDEHIRVSDVVFRGTVLHQESYVDPADNTIYTRTALRVDEPLKGKLPPIVNVIHRGGAVGDMALDDDASPQFRVGEEHLLFASRRGNGTLFATQGGSSAVTLRRGNHGFVQQHEDFLNQVRARTANSTDRGADVTDQEGAPVMNGTNSSGSFTVTSNGLLQDTNGISARFPAPDAGETVPYLVDMDSLPSGISPSNALVAVSNAFAAWAAVSSFRFTFAGTQSFGAASPNIIASDGIIRIQLHDNYNFITSSNVLGQGGRRHLSSLLSPAGWGSGGKVNTNEFHLATSGYVVIEATNTLLQTLSTLTEVLCHEVGHAIGLAHSSETPSEPNTTLSQAIMYYAAHADGRGATLGTYDPPIVRLIHPTNNTPPYSYNRVIDAVTAPTAPAISGINEIELRGYDLQSATVTLAITNVSGNYGTFTLTNSLLKYVPGYLGSPTRLDPADSSYYDVVFARFSDGTNASAYIWTRVLSYLPDTAPATSDGIPDEWMIKYFTNADPTVGSNHRATNDLDGDRLINLQEYRAGMVPTNSSSAQLSTMTKPGTIQWQAKAYELYEIRSSTNLASTNWTRVGNPIMPTNAALSIRTNLITTAITATASNLPTTNSRTFYRVLKVP